MSLLQLKLSALWGMNTSFLRALGHGIVKPSALNPNSTPDLNKEHSYYPSPLSLELYIPPKTDFSHAFYPDAYQGNKWKILTILTDDKYLPVEDGKFFSSGNHPVETFLPLLHLIAAGFSVDIATISGKSAQFEEWAMPKKDKAVLDISRTLVPQLENPLDLREIIHTKLGPDSDYLAVFIPGGHGAVNGLPESEAVQATLDWAMTYDKFIISLCHGPAAFLSSTIKRNESIFAGYKICVFPDKMDKKTNVTIGYLPDNMFWYVGEKLRSIGVDVINSSVIGQVHKDRNILTGDSPLASNNLGRLAARTLLDYVHTSGE